MAENPAVHHSLFTAETARKAAYKSAEARRAKKIADTERLEAAKALILAAANGVALTRTAPNDSSHARASVVALEKQIERLDEQLLTVVEPDDWQKLSTARQRLFVQWQVLVGLAGPGNRKPGREKPQRQHVIQGPLDALD